MPDETIPQEVKETEAPETQEEEKITDEHIAAEKDPAKQEHLKARQQKQNEGPPEGSKRWNEIYRQAKEGERTIAELQKKMSDMESEYNKTFTELANHNRELAKAMKAADAPKEESPQQALERLKQEQKQARQEYDYDKAFEIQDQITNLVIAISQVKPEGIKRVVKDTVIQDEVSSAVNEFSERNAWFLEKVKGKDNPDYDYVKSGAAQALERKLLPTWKGSYRALLKKVEDEINEKFSITPVKVPAVGGDGDTPPTKDKFEMSDEMKRVARMMFPDEKDPVKVYAEQLKFMGRTK